MRWCRGQTGIDIVDAVANQDDMLELSFVHAVLGDLVLEVAAVGEKKRPVKPNHINKAALLEAIHHSIVQAMVAAKGKRRHMGAHAFVKKYDEG